MASSNNSNDGLFWLAVLALVILYFLAFILFAIAAFAALIMTLVALCAWNDDLHLGRLVIDTDDARSFVFRGLLGAALTPLFCAFVGMLYDFTVDWRGLPYFLLFGYTVGSVGIEYWLHRGRREEARYAAYHEATASRRDRLPAPPALPAPHAALLPPPTHSGPPFRFASWDDEAGA